MNFNLFQNVQCVVYCKEFIITLPSNLVLTLKYYVDNCCYWFKFFVKKLPELLQQLEKVPPYGCNPRLQRWGPSGPAKNVVQFCLFCYSNFVSKLLFFLFGNIFKLPLLRSFRCGHQAAPLLHSSRFDHQAAPGCLILDFVVPPA